MPLPWGVLSDTSGFFAVERIYGDHLGVSVVQLVPLVRIILDDFGPPSITGLCVNIPVVFGEALSVVAIRDCSVYRVVRVTLW